MYREKIAGVGMNDSKRICTGSGINESTSKRSLSVHSSSSTGRAFSLLRAESLLELPSETSF